MSHMNRGYIDRPRSQVISWDNANVAQLTAESPLRYSRFCEYSTEFSLPLQRVGNRVPVVYYARVRKSWWLRIACTDWSNYFFAESQVSLFSLSPSYVYLHTSISPNTRPSSHQRKRYTQSWATQATISASWSSEEVWFTFLPTYSSVYLWQYTNYVRSQVHVGGL